MSLGFGPLTQGLGIRVGPSRSTAKNAQILAHQSIQAESADPRRHELDDEAWHDLDGDQLFEALNHTSSVAGAQSLYDRLRRPFLCPAALAEFRELVALLEQTPSLRAEITDLLQRQRPDSGWWDAPRLLYREPPSLPVPHWLLHLLPPLLGASIAATIWLSPLFFYAGLVLLFAIVLCHARVQSHVDSSLASLLNLAAVLGVAVRLRDHKYEALRPLQEALAQLPRAVLRIRRHGFWLAFKDPFGMLEYAQVIQLFHARRYAACRRAITEHQPALRKLYSAVGTLDVALSIPKLRAAGGGRWTEPKFQLDTKSELCAQGLYHPLIDEAVVNDIKLDQRGLLITGLNMSGKSSMLRATGLGVVLAQSIDTVFADDYAAPPMRVFVAMGCQDSLTQGRSYYQSELHKIQSIVTACEDDRPSLILLDEVFRGTNSVERIAMAAALINHVAPRQRLMAATHDMQLVSLTTETMAAMHFTEYLHDSGEYRFDYRMKPGPCPTRNAIDLLQRMDFPGSIVAEARRLTRLTEPGG